MKGVQIPTYDGVGVISGEHGGGELKSLKSQRAKKKTIRETIGGALIIETMCVLEKKIMIVEERE